MERDSYKEILEFHCPRYDELPGIDLYMDQVLSIIEDVLKPFSVDEKVLTSSMVNNYVKQRIVSPPVNKKYSRTHMAYLLVVCILKKVFSISEICRMITLQIETHPLEESYDFFCAETERALRVAFLEEADISSQEEREASEERRILRGAVMSFAQKVRVQKCLEDRLRRDHPEQVSQGRS